ncbi:MAG TPA: FAD-dependent monooxygenase [Xanthobacteraceae bacterium]|nr:FAD-dependent monooxygenase [Xanthobacteraceae bacterium]
MRKTKQTEGRCDVLIAGAGFAGLALAIALRQGLGETFAVTVADPALGRAARPDARASAIAAAARRLLESIGVWEQVSDAAQPILDMAITDSRLNDTVRPTLLTFAGEVDDGEPFAHMVENTPLQAALKDKAQQNGVMLLPHAVIAFEHLRPSYAPHSGTLPESGAHAAGVSSRIDVTCDDGSSISTRLLVAADGARSRVREQAGIKTVGWDYGQSAIVTTVAHERDHCGRAEEHFMPAGPFAILPLQGRRCSIVWTEEARAAERIVALPAAEFHAELERRFGLHLGELRVVEQPRSFPLGLHVARSFVAERIALVGDAAHVIHPIAGQGLNLGLRDVAALAEAVADAARLGLDIGGADVLDRYQRWRRFDTMAMGIATDGLNRLFSNESDALRLVRDIGLGLVERAPALKNFFIREAAGLTGEVPRLLRGEAL